MLSVAPDAPAEEIKKAFRREIARYHPDKVQHLCPEFQDMAAGIAADLTEAYRVLMDPALRAKYNGDLFGGTDVEGASKPCPSYGAMSRAPTPTDVSSNTSPAPPTYLPSP